MVAISMMRSRACDSSSSSKRSGAARGGRRSPTVADEEVCPVRKTASPWIAPRLVKPLPSPSIRKESSRIVELNGMEEEKPG